MLHWPWLTFIGVSQFQGKFTEIAIQFSALEPRRSHLRISMFNVLSCERFRIVLWPNFKSEKKVQDRIMEVKNESSYVATCNFEPHHWVLLLWIGINLPFEIQIPTPIMPATRALEPDQSMKYKNWILEI